MPTEKITHKLYKGKIEIDFYPNNHRYKIVGEKKYLVGVTTATDMLDKSAALLPWATGLAREYLFEKLESGEPINAADIIESCKQYEIKRDTAADIGTQIHDWIDQYIAGKDPEVPKDEKVANGVLAFLDWVDKNKVKFEQSEKIVYSKKYQYVGKMDAIAIVNGVRTLIDYKSSKGVYLPMRYQTAAYLVAWNEEHGQDIKDRMILHLGKETGEFRAIDFTDEKELMDDFECFLALLKLKEHDKVMYNWKREINM